MAGAGPAGATTSKILSSNGLSVALVEKSGPPRDKVCGGLLTSPCLDRIKRIFGCPPPKETRQSPEELGIFVIPPSGVVNGFKATGEVLSNVKRRELDEWLSESAVASGVQLVRDTAVVDFSESPEGVSVKASGRDGSISLEANCMIGADGVHSAVRSKISRRSASNLVIYAQEYFRPTGQVGDSFHMVYDGDISPVYSYFMPKGDTVCLGVGILGGRPPDLPTGMRRLRELIERDFGSVLGKSERHEGFPAPFGDIVLGGGRTLLVGDAAGFCNPLTGEGIGYAIATGEAAAKAVMECGSNALEAYSESVKGIAAEVEELVRQTLLMSNEERERRVAARRKRAEELSSRSGRGPTANP